MQRLLAYRPPRIAALLVVIAFGLCYFSPAKTLLFIPYKLIGTVCMISGFSIMMWAWGLFKKAATAICPTAETAALVTHGAYRFSRNPMYLGMLLILFGAAFLMGAVPAFLAPAVFFVSMDKVFIPYEEEKLRKGFGDDYARYAEQTRQWL